MKFHWAAAATLVSASNAKVGSWKTQQKHHGSSLATETSQAGDSHSQKISASKNAQQAPVHPIDSSTSWYPGKYGLLKNNQARGVPCNPNHDDVSKNDPDVGILGCEPGLVCQEDPVLDGTYHCVSEDETLHASRKLDDFYGDCDYSDFDEATYVGTVVCTYPDTCGDEYGLSETTCARLIISTTYNGSPYDTTPGPYCYNIFEGEYDDANANGDIVEVCFVPSDSMDDSCSLAVGEDDCNACTVIGAGTPDGCIQADCSNTCAGGTLDFCDTDFSPALNCFDDGDDGDKDDGSAGDDGGGDDDEDDDEDGALGSLSVGWSSFALTAVAASSFMTLAAF